MSSRSAHLSLSLSFSLQDQEAAHAGSDVALGAAGFRRREDIGRAQPGAHIVPDETAVVHDRGRQRAEPVQGSGDHGARGIPEQDVPAALGQSAVGRRSADQEHREPAEQRQTHDVLSAAQRYVSTGKSHAVVFIPIPGAGRSECSRDNSGRKKVPSGSNLTFKS